MPDDATEHPPGSPDLSNCDREPIHIPGAIQPHGALLAFDADLRLCGWSASASDWLAIRPAPDRPAAALGLGEEVLALLDECLASAAQGESPPLSGEVQANGHLFDVVVHMHQQRVLLEYEIRHVGSPEIASFALQANRAISRLRRTRQAEELLQIAVHEIRKLTGFDRVMAYRFRHDDSGDIVSEDVADDMDPYLGRRYPASDIPAQARRLYTINTLRLIADVAYRPSPLLCRPDVVPLDLSHSILRSVSPIHVEYLSNMGVQASMSVSIVVRGRLWGLIACHHRQPLLVPHSVRMACDVMAQVIATSVEAAETRRAEGRSRQCAQLNSAIVQDYVSSDDLAATLGAHAPDMARLLECDGFAIVSRQGREVQAGATLPAGLPQQALASLADASTDIVCRNGVADWPAGMAPASPWVGLLAIRCDAVENLWALFWRLEQIETVRWGGKPEKLVRIGPLGPRLTPRGSFEEWKETVSGCAVPWTAADIDCAQELLHAIHRALSARMSELDRAKNQMLAILGHDLRDPLHSISMAAQIMTRHHDPASLGRRIHESSGRMQKLIAHMLDMSRIRSGLGLGIRRSDTDLSALLSSLVDEAEIAHGRLPHQRAIEADVRGQLDADRVGQLVSNLLGNARHHGDPARAVEVALRGETDETGRPVAVLGVANVAAPIPAERVARLFSPFKDAGSEAGTGATAHRGLGLGLYIARQIALEHGGDLSYHHEHRPGDAGPGWVIFVARLPMGDGAASSALRVGA